MSSFMEATFEFYQKWQDLVFIFKKIFLVHLRRHVMT